MQLGCKNANQAKPLFRKCLGNFDVNPISRCKLPVIRWANMFKCWRIETDSSNLMHSWLENRDLLKMRFLKVGLLCALFHCKFVVKSSSYGRCPGPHWLPCLVQKSDSWLLEYCKDTVIDGNCLASSLVANYALIRFARQRYPKMVQHLLSIHEHQQVWGVRWGFWHKDWPHDANRNHLSSGTWRAPQMTLQFSNYKPNR